MKNILNQGIQNVKHMGLVFYLLITDLFSDAFKPGPLTTNETKWFARATLFMFLLGIASIFMLMAT